VVLVDNYWIANFNLYLSEEKMNKVDELWDILVDAVQISAVGEDMFCTPITGGLDSRVLMGIMRERGIPIRLSYWIRTPQNLINTEHIFTLRALLKPDYFHVIDVDELPKDFPWAIEQLGKLQTLKQYSFIMALNMDVYTGMLKTRKKERAYFKTTHPQMYLDTMRINKPFKEVILPFENTRTVGYLMSLNRRDRFFQGLYMDMIREKLPDLAEVPRCFEKGTGSPVRLNGDNTSYILTRILTKVMK
jgi:hypothetical protein